RDRLDLRDERGLHCREEGADRGRRTLCLRAPEDRPAPRPPRRGSRRALRRVHDPAVPRHADRLRPPSAHVARRESDREAPGPPGHRGPLRRQLALRFWVCDSVPVRPGPGAVFLRRDDRGPRALALCGAVFAGVTMAAFAVGLLFHATADVLPAAWLGGGLGVLFFSRRLAARPFGMTPQDPSKPQNR